MIVKAIQPNGTPHYFNAFTGRKVKSPRYRDAKIAKPGRLPAEALRFLSPAMPTAKPTNIEPLKNRMERRNEQSAFDSLVKVNTSIKLSWFKRFYNWIKKRMNG